MILIRQTTVMRLSFNSSSEERIQVAQFFYDLSIIDKNGIPVMPKGPRSSEWNSANAKFGKVKGMFAQLGFTGGGSDSRMGLAAGVNVTDVEVLLKSSISFYNFGADVPNTAGPSIFLRSQGAEWSNARAKNGYYFCLNGSSTLSNHSRTLTVYSYENGNFGTLNFQSATLMNAPTSPLQIFGEFFYFRVKAQGTNLMAKAWKESEVEPSSWMLSTTNNIFTGPGDVFLSLERGTAFVVPFFSVGTNGDPAPMSFPGGNRVVSGTLLKPDGSPADGYMVRCYHRESGYLLGETLASAIGAFSFSLPIPSTEKVYCVGVDQLGNTWNAPIKDLIAPVSP